MAQWFCHAHCKPEDAGSIPRFFSQSDETINRVFHMNLAVGETLHQNQSSNQSTNIYKENASLAERAAISQQMTDQLPGLN